MKQILEKKKIRECDYEISFNDKIYFINRNHNLWKINNKNNIFLYRDVNSKYLNFQTLDKL